MIRDIGSFVGLISGCFVFYERARKGRPIASFTFTQEDSRPSARIRVKNSGAHDVAIFNITVWPKAFLLAEEPGPDGNLRASFGARPTFILKPDESKEVRLVTRFKDGIPIEALGDKSVHFFVWWRRCNATWLPQIPVIVSTTISHIREFGWQG